jgi:hypothetical protein
MRLGVFGRSLTRRGRRRLRGFRRERLPTAVRERIQPLSLQSIAYGRWNGEHQLRRVGPPSPALFYRIPTTPLLICSSFPHSRKIQTVLFKYANRENTDICSSVNVPKANLEVS